jgi:hypothetical protein
VSITGTSPGSATLTISTTGPSSNAAVTDPLRNPQRNVPVGTFLACVFLFATRKKCRLLQRIVWGIILLSAFGASSCGGGSNSGGTPPPGNPGTTPGTYIVTVKGTSGSLSAQNTLTVTVQ